ncbi:acetyltransferase [Vallitalea pronyensis]|uniref:Acetyltransferase n=2 Tax=Vallitalea pronyensis TaxID=1348613 RepID=A0A8J8MQC0_9FIRM|nr:acetyltransferase [Vallitalea pronyensis]QUI25846.1 acetyltransferase [Vallitalea pronyensis]
MNNRILLIGGGGHCKSVLDSLITSFNFTDIAIIDTKENLGKEILNRKIIGTDDDLEKLFNYGYKNAFITVGSIGDTRLRRKLFEMLKKIGFNIPSIIDSSAIVSENAKLDRGIFIGKNAVINIGSVIGEGAIINTGTIIEHDCIVGEFAHIAPGTVLCGDVVIEENVHIGARAVIKQQIRIGNDSIIGMGSVVLNDIPPNSIAYGNPCTINWNKAKRKET